MKMPENSEVMATATFIMLAYTPRLRLVSSAILSIVWTNSQNATTPMMMPKSSRPLPLHGVFD